MVFVVTSFVVGPVCAAGLEVEGVGNGGVEGGNDEEDDGDGEGKIKGLVGVVGEGTRLVLLGDGEVDELEEDVGDGVGDGVGGVVGDGVGGVVGEGVGGGVVDDVDDGEGDDVGGGVVDDVDDGVGDGVLAVFMVHLQTDECNASLPNSFHAPSGESTAVPAPELFGSPPDQFV
tara:strand:- start:322 stop:843 length:522 start_codon:yes stop_codon:yes gene_type:complete